MNKEQFIVGLENAVTNSLSDDVIYILEHVSKLHNQEIKDLSNWYIKLSETEKEHIKTLIKMSGFHTMFGVMCVLDGVRALEPESDEEKIELYFESNGNKHLINADKGEYLHDMWKERNG